ncbi:S-layer homology domain-containing protein [Lysinibacillus irui]|uniref:S-layer homology domain-containing protein n=1 Tax=Lysinibacillus irui TaxID=2998077 RepID=UPI002AD5960D|nr:S-layer homology domain-containing protein [Lysinibacillus irui]MEA0563568.1 S-layer homology domain-containing protein [Lysinibacillus irui]
MERKQKKWWQRSLAFMLSLVLVISSFLVGGMPVSYAADEGAPLDGIYVSSEGDDSNGDGSFDKPYKTLQMAYNKVDKEGTIYVKDDITLTLNKVGQHYKFLDMNLLKNVTITTAPEVEPDAVIRRGSGETSLIDLQQGQLTLKDIIIDGDFSGTKTGGRLINVGNAKLIVEDGAVLRNNYTGVTGSAVVLLNNTSAVEMTGGEITNNKASSAVSIYASGATFKMTAGEITDNSGGGVDVAAGGHFILSGKAQITGNTVDVSGKPTERNVNLQGTTLVTLNGDFEGKAGITAQNRNSTGKHFGQAETAGLTGLENLIADNDPNLFATYGEAGSVIWQSLELVSPIGTVPTNKPTFTGIAVPGSIVTVKIGDITLTTTADEDGNWSVEPKTVISNGPHSVVVTALKGDTQFGPVTKDITVAFAGPGGVSTGLSSWVDVERSAVIEEGTNITKLTDLADSGTWSPVGAPNSNVPNALNFNGGLQITSSNGYYSRLSSDFAIKNISSGEVFSVQASTNYSGFPWEFGGGANSNAIYGVTSGKSIRTYFGRTEGYLDGSVGDYELKNGAMLNVWSEVSDWALSLNGIKLTQSDVNTPRFVSPVSGQYYFGAGHNSRFNGMIAETILFNHKLGENERKQVNSYLALKYGLTLKDDYIASDGSTKMWTVTTGYGNHITGIGRDDNGALYHKQSKSQVNGANITIALGNEIQATNAENLNAITNDKSFFVFSDNGKDATFSTPLSKEDEQLQHTERIYKIEKTNWQDAEITLQVDKVEGALEWPLYLVISADDKFDTSDSFHQLTDGKVTLESSKFTNGAYFTIAAPVPTFESASLEQAQAGGNQITLTFDKDVALPDGKGFTITIGGNTIENATFTVDPANAKKVNITLPNGTDVTGKEVTVKYDATGNLKGTNGVPVSSFIEEVTTQNPGVDKEYVDYTEITEVTGIAPAGVTYDSTAGKFTVPANVEEFTFNDGDKKMQATKGTDGEWIIKKVDTKQYVDYVEVTAVDGIAPAGVTYDSTAGKFTVPANVEEFTFNDGDKKMQATKGTDGEWVIKEVDTVTPPSYDDLFIIKKPTGVIKDSKPEIAGTVDMTTTPSTVTIELKNSNNESILVDGIAIVDPITGEWSFTPPTNLEEGTYTIVATATNGIDTSVKEHEFTVNTMQVVDKTKLRDKVNQSNRLDSNKYTPDTWAKYQEALKIAQDVLNDPNAKIDEVEAAFNALTAAQDALVEKPTLTTAGLGSLVPSQGVLSPSFSSEVTDYTMNVDYATSQLSFLATPIIPGASVTTTVNGQLGTLEQIPLQVGENIIVITVADGNGNVKHYTIKVYREAYTGGGNSGGGGTWTPDPTPPVTPTPSETKTKIQVELEIDGDNPLEKTTVEIERTKYANGDVTDFVNLTPAQALEAVEKAKQIGNSIARIVIPDVNDEVDQVTVEVPKQSLQTLRDNGLSLEISTENGHIAIPHSSMEGIDDNFYFRLIPVKKESERQAIEERAKAEQVVRETLESDDVHVVARPMTIETNMPSRPVQVTLPLKGVNVPTVAAERQAFLDQLAVFIEHSDGEKKVVFPEVVTMAKGELGLRFTVEKFSTFTIIQFEKPEVSKHEAYIKGFPNGTFGPDKNVTRAQVAIMMARILGYTEVQAVDKAPFKDVAKDHSAAGAIAFVKEQGIMNGDQYGNFHANANITRAEMAAVVANYKQFSVEQGVAITFKDTKGHWAQWIIEANRASGIINGLEDGSFAPNAALTRAQAVVMMNRMFERGPLQGVAKPSFPDVKATHWAFKEIEEAANSHKYFIDEDGKEQLSK